MAEPHRGVVAYVQAAGAGRGGFRRRLRDRSGGEDRHPAIESQSETMGVGPHSQIAKASEAHFCVPYLRNEALRRWVNTSKKKGQGAQTPSPLALLRCLRSP